MSSPVNNLGAWAYNSNTGVIGWFPYPVIYFELSSGLGWHGPFDSQQKALDYYNSNKGKNPGWKAPTSDIGTAVSNAESSAASAVTSAVTPQWLKGVNWSVLMLQIGEILLGIVLIGVGVATLTGQGNSISKLVKVAAL